MDTGLKSWTAGTDRQVEAILTVRPDLKEASKLLFEFVDLHAPDDAIAPAIYAGEENEICLAWSGDRVVVEADFYSDEEEKEVTIYILFREGDEASTLEDYDPKDPRLAKAMDLVTRRKD